LVTKPSVAWREGAGVVACSPRSRTGTSGCNRIPISTTTTYTSHDDSEVLLSFFLANQGDHEDSDEEVTTANCTTTLIQHHRRSSISSSGGSNISVEDDGRRSRLRISSGSPNSMEGLLSAQQLLPQGLVSRERWATLTLICIGVSSSSSSSSSSACR